MIEQLHTISEKALQELLRIEMVQQLIEQPKSGSPYFVRPKRHLDLALKILTQDTLVHLIEKSDEALQNCITRIKEHAEDEHEDSAVALSAKQITNLEGLITFAKLYYCWIIRKSIISSPMSINRRIK